MQFSTEQSQSDTEALCFLALCDLRGVGFETLKSIARDRIPFASYFSQDQQGIRAKSFQGKAYHARLSDALDSGSVREELLDSGRRRYEYLRKKKTSLIFSATTRFPKRLLDLRDPPEWLFVEGNEQSLNGNTITAVGSRKVSADGRWLAEYLGHTLSELNAITVSGLAEGVDQIVHQSSIRNDLPTIAVLGTGILTDYPSGSGQIRDRIVATGGAIVTEYLPKESFSAKNFVRRNRIQSALGSCVFPIEWAVKSGTAHTVQFANELKRPLVFARTPEQNSFDWVPAEYRQVGHFFTLPKDHVKFVATLRDLLSGRGGQQLLI